VSQIDRVLDEVRRGLPPRPVASDLPALVARGALIVDIRPVEQRQRDGELPGALVIDRNVLEWRLDPTSAHRVIETIDADREIVLVCNEGYASTLAAVSLQHLGLRRATDLDGGFQAVLAESGRNGPDGTARERVEDQASVAHDERAIDEHVDDPR
jgi:rhodanese-related sulfurtransferase